ncbi:type III secretion system stator protein SctL [Pseudomonas fluorescens]|uniref:Type III secretion system stator protein SctL n=2 Tax=Pseudomonas fluorescens group TaxID=136843 RepID=A0AAE2Q2H1_PSEFL|nr:MULTISPECIES: type III secretion system stator protein SctL [Pseudomonas fluorescens group]MBA1427010.1 HrpE/YscL family type III secretion apparatus protein [Pseudomonas orientalis]MBD8147414.1 type III secretion system stator protein SctL [Pseudomonas fluorescens]MBD8175886.1 type III secretion system stator protein SctL [Pseudomonas fluorescens]MBD8272430.1 type III secretion system stator protein SctL [Pseudomonas fluorescens]MBD8744341.1 type III secretion system stator protein SctL [P
MKTLKLILQEFCLTMLCRRKIELSIATATLPYPLIPKALMADSQCAEHLLSDAQAQAEVLLRQAQEQSEMLLERAQAEFWQKSNRQLQRWEAERQLICGQLEKAARAITTQALSKLLELVPPAERINAILKKMLDVQVPAIKATLACHPEDHAHVEQWLNLHSQAPWSLRLDATLAAQTLILETDEGSFHVQWSAAVDNLLALDSSSIDG